MNVIELSREYTSKSNSEGGSSFIALGYNFGGIELVLGFRQNLVQYKDFKTSGNWTLRSEYEITGSTQQINAGLAIVF